MIAARYASLIAFAQARAFCPRGEGNGIDNSCGAKTMSAPDKDGGGGGSTATAAKDTWDDNTWSDSTTGGGTFDELPEGLSSLGSLSFHPSTTTADVMGIAKQTGIKGPSQLLTIGACNVPDADVRLTLYSSNQLSLRADIPAGSKKSDGSIEVITSIVSGEDGPQIEYGLLSLDEKAQKNSGKDESFQRRVAGKVFEVMLSSMEAAEKAGFVSAETLADGYGPGNTNGIKTEMQGYRLWGKFGFDGDVPRGWFMSLQNKGVDVSESLTPLDSIRLREDGVVRLQQVLATKKGEAIWKQWGIPLPLTFDFKDKTSDGYLRYQRMLSLSKKAKSYRSLFFEYVAGLETREDPSLWGGFPEQRAFCPNGEGNGVTNDCGPGQTAKSFPEGSQNLRDAVDSVAPDPEQVWNRSKGLAETPAPKQMDDIANEQTSYSGAALTPEAEASYGSLVDEIGRQYEALTAAGLRVRAWRGDGEPYGDPPGSTKPNSNKMREEVAKTGEFSFFMTDKGFGTGDATPNHPMLRETKYKTADGEPMIANDLFRVVHDMVAHVRGGYSFSTNGEYNGMLTHASTLPEEAWPALFAETFGQNAVYEKTKQYAPQNAYASKVGPAIIRSELKKRTKSSRAAKTDSDEPLGYQHIKSRPALLKSLVEERAFCPNGEGNGVTNDCGATSAASQATPQVKQWAKDKFQSPEKAKAFVKWFGDSEVVSDSGEPLVVFHGTAGNAMFDEFDIGKGSTASLHGPGIYLTDSSGIASEYGSGGQVKPLYASIKSPMDLDARATPESEKAVKKALESYREESPKKGWQAKVNASINEALRRLDASGSNQQMLTSIHGTHLGIEERETPSGRTLVYKSFGTELNAELLTRGGFDGIKHRGGSIMGDGRDHAVFIAFSPSQVKSATGNAGTFDGKDKRITRSEDVACRSADCGREDDGKFGGGNKCQVTNGVLKPETVEPHGEEPSFKDEDDDHVYHVTTEGNAESILSGGFKQSPHVVKGGAYESYSKGKVFFTEKSGLATWKGKIEDHLFHSHDDPPPVAIVKIKKSEVEHLLRPDEIGTKDAGAKAYYVDLNQKKRDSRAFCPTGKGGGVDNSCSIGINVNDSSQDFTVQIPSGSKTTETRITHSLKPYVGKTVGIVRTGKGKATLVGTMKIGEPKFYKTAKEFDADFDKHQVGKDSPHYIGTEGKYGYPLTEVKPVKPVTLDSKGIVARVIHKSKRDITVEYQLGGESPEHPRVASRSDCGREDDGKFSSGNKCAGSVDMPKEDPRGRMRYENGVQTDAARKLYQMGSSEKRLKSLVDVMGGDPKNTRVDINPPSLNISVADKGGNKLFHVDLENGRARVYPAKDLTPAEAAKIKEAAGEAFGGRQSDHTIKVFSKAEDMKKWESENAAKLKKSEDKYKFSTLLPPHQRPKKWERSLDARYASLLAFAEARDCGQDKDGKFSKGNTCASGLAADVAKGAASGAALGATSGFFKTFQPQAAAASAAYGAVAGAVKGIYDNKMRPTRVSARITSLGLTDKGIAKIVKSLSGSNKSVASTTGRARLTLKIKDKEGKVTHVVDLTKKTVTIYPKKASKELTDSELQAVKAIAAQNAPKQTSFAVKTDSLSYAKRIARNGFEVAANKAGVLIATASISGAYQAAPDVVLGITDLLIGTHFTDSFYRKPNAKR